MRINAEIEKFRKYLKGKGLKFTPERKNIVKEIFSINGHFDVESLYRRMERNKNVKISLATIYRTIPLLVKSGMIREVLRCEGRGVYENIWGHKHHDHLICINCGKVIEFSDERIEKLQQEVCRKFHFKPVEYRLGIRGYCEKCWKEREKLYKSIENDLHSQE